ncbi:MAG TPA: ROK family protein [Pseudomonadales bacterium]
MDEQRILVFDIGGTTTRAGVFDLVQGQLVRCVRTTTPSCDTHPDAPGDELRSMLYQVLATLATRLDVNAPPVVSVAFPGPVDDAGVALRAPTVWGHDERPEPVAARLRQLWPSARVLVTNDLSAAGLCFLRSDTDELCVVTVSSGIGHKVFLRGEPIVGRSGRGGEIGHVRVDFSEGAPRCDCGGIGHLGAVASGRGIRNRALRLARLDPEGFGRSYLGQAVAGDLTRLDNRIVARAFCAGDRWTADLIAASAEPLGRVLATIHCAVGIERFVVIGGIAHALGPAYLRLIGSAAARSEWALGQRWDEMLELGQLGDDAGLIGAGRLAARCMLE